MAVGRLPRNQRNIGGTTTTAAATTTPVRSGPIRYPNVRWEATLREPQGVFPAAPRTFVVDVVGNIDLQGVPVRLGIRPRRPQASTSWYPAAWLSTDANRGTLTAHVPNPPRDRCDVLVHPQAAGQQPTIPCQNGRIVVQ